MSSSDKAGIVLIIPSDFDLRERIGDIEACIQAADGFHLACLRLNVTDQPRETILKRADMLRDLGHRYDISVVLDDHFSIAKETGLDGVHLKSADLKLVREAKKALGEDAILGVYAGASKHDGMSAAEIGTDYISFGPINAGGLDIDVVNPEIFQWWSEMIEVPVIAEGGHTVESLAAVKDHVDFVAFGREVLDTTHPSTALRALLDSL